LFNSQPTTGNVSGDIASLVAGQGMNFGDFSYLKADGKFWKASASGISGTPCIAMAAATISSGVAGNFLLHGFAKYTTWGASGASGMGLSGASGSVLYLSMTPGLITPAAPTTTDSVTQILGVLMTKESIYFAPEKNTVVKT
jgi:hypothetical protein